MLGAIIGDMAGSVYEWNSIKTKRFPFLGPGCRFTDDTVMTLAVASACLLCPDLREEGAFETALVREMRRIGRLYPDRGYGGRFQSWLLAEHPGPYNSFGNGSAMRVSPVAWAAESLSEAERLAESSAAVTHNHPEGIRGAKAAAAAVFLARKGAAKAEIRAYLEANYYPLSFTLDEIRPSYAFDVSCQGSVPQAIVSFLESEDFEDAVRNAVSLGGDSDTIACIAGAIAEAHYGIPAELRHKALSLLGDKMLLRIYEQFRARFPI